MEDNQITPESTEQVVQTGGAESPVADVKEDATAASEESQQPAKPKKATEQERFAELAFKAREAERKAKAEAEARERERADFERQIAELREGKGGAPKPDAFESYDEYLRELTKWEVRQEIEQHSKKSAEEARKAKASEDKSRKAARLESVVTAGADAYKDFHATLQALDQAVANPEEIRGALDVVLESEKSVDLIYYLGKNPSFVASLSDMTPIQQAREIGRLEEKLQSKKLTAAPAPVEPLRGNGGRVTSDAPPADPAKYREWRAKHMK